MGAALNTAGAGNAYVLSDRGTWISFKNKGDLVIAVEGDKRLFNQYGVMLVNPEKHPNVKKELGQQFIDWLVSPEGQKAIADYKINGEQLFYPNAEIRRGGVQRFLEEHPRRWPAPMRAVLATGEVFPRPCWLGCARRRNQFPPPQFAAQAAPSIRPWRTDAAPQATSMIGKR